MDARLLIMAVGTFWSLAGAGVNAAEHRVTMAGMTYQPTTIIAKVGDTITFINDDDTDHAVFIPTKGHATNLGTQKPGSTGALPLRRSGVFEVECVNHATMLLKVSVQ